MIDTKKQWGLDRRVMVRVPPGIHRNLAIKAAETGISLNRVVSSKLSQ